MRRVLLAAVAVALLTPLSAAGAASDPLAGAVARVTAAEKADNRATAAYDAAQTRFYQLTDEQASSQHSIATLTAQQRHLAALGRLRAVVAYTRGSLGIGVVLGNGADILDAARRATMLDDVNARGDEVIAQLVRRDGELHDRQADAAERDRQRAGSARDDEGAVERRPSVRSRRPGKPRSELRTQLAAQKRLAELSTVLRVGASASRVRRRDSAPSSGVPSGGGSAGQIIVAGTWVCPVQGPVSFTDTYGSPRSGGRRHKGNDLFAPIGTPLVAVTDGSVFFQGDPLGGNAAYVEGHDGNTYYYAHLNDYVGGARSGDGRGADRSRRQHRRRRGRSAAAAFRDPPGRPERPGHRPVPHVGRSLLGKPQVG